MSSEVISVLISAVVSIYFGICCNALSKKENIDIWIKTADKHDILQKAFALSSRLADGLFGERLVSARAIIWSFILSISFFGLCLWIAFYTTPALMSDIHWYGLPSILIVSVALTMEYLYVTKTRLILKTIAKDERRSSWKISTFFFIDLISTYWLFVVGLSLVLLLALFSEQIYRTDINITTSALATSEVDGRRIMIPWNPYFAADFFKVMATITYRIYEQVASGFQAFFGIELWSKTGETLEGRNTLVPLAVVPFTTLAASTLATTIWVSLCYIAGLSLLIFCKWWYLLGWTAKHLMNPNVASAIAAGGALGVVIYAALRILLSAP